MAPIQSCIAFPPSQKALRATTRHRRSWTSPLLWPKSVWRVVTCLANVRTSLVAIGMSVGGPNPVLYSLSSFYWKALRATTRHRRSWTAPLLWPKSVWRVVTCLVYVRTSLVVIGMSVGGPDPVLYSLSSFSEGPSSDHQTPRVMDGSLVVAQECLEGCNMSCLCKNKSCGDQHVCGWPRSSVSVHSTSIDLLA